MGHRNSDDIIESLKKKIAMKDFVIAAKDDNIKKNEEQIRILLFENKDLKKRIENQNQSEIGGTKCKNCEQMFKTEVDCNEHMLANHSENSEKCLNCKANSQKVENLKCLTGRLQGMTKEFMEEKKRHKEICVLASKCSHDMMCP